MVQDPSINQQVASVVQISAIAEELLKTEYDACRIVYNKFGSAVAFKPTIATVLSPDVSHTLLFVQLCNGGFADANFVTTCKTIFYELKLCYAGPTSNCADAEHW